MIYSIQFHSRWDIIEIAPGKAAKTLVSHPSETNHRRLQPNSHQRLYRCLLPRTPRGKVLARVRAPSHTTGHSKSAIPVDMWNSHLIKTCKMSSYQHILSPTCSNDLRASHLTITWPTAPIWFFLEIMKRSPPCYPIFHDFPFFSPDFSWFFLGLPHPFFATATLICSAHQLQTFHLVGRRHQRGTPTRPGVSPAPPAFNLQPGLRMVT